MINFFALHWNAENHQEESAAQNLIQKTQEDYHQWETVFQKQGLVVFCLAAPAHRVLCLPGKSGVILGKLFKKINAAPDENPYATLTQSDTDKVIQTNGNYLTENFWGAYVSILCADDGTLLIGRDCSTLQLCYTTQHNGVFLAFSHFDFLPFADGIQRDINWSFIAYNARFGKAPFVETGLSNIRQIVAGEYVQIHAQRKQEHRLRSWKPENYINNQIEDEEEAKRTLRTALLSSLHAQSSEYKRIFMMLSGGLDSSILFASLRRHQPSITVTPYHSDSSDGDLSEEHYAQGLAHAYNTKLYVQKIQATVNQSIASDLPPPSPVPVNQGFTSDDDSYFLQYINQTNAEAVFSGQGGDQIFFKKPQVAPFYDYIESHNFNLKAIDILLDTARLSGSSIWKLLKKSNREKHNARRFIYFENKNVFMSEDVCEHLDSTSIYQDHPWFAQGEDFPFGKHHQLFQFTHFNQYSFKYSHSLHNLDIVTPLVCQPLMETVLRIPSFLLMLNGRNRGLARDAFRYLLTQEIYNREQKGFVTKFFFNYLIMNLKNIREFLLEGVLVKAGFLNKKALEAHLNEDSIRTETVGVQIINLINNEKWARSTL